MKTETPNYQVIVDGLGFLLLQEYIICRVLDIWVSKVMQSYNVNINDQIILLLPA